MSDPEVTRAAQSALLECVQKSKDIVSAALGSRSETNTTLGFERLKRWKANTVLVLQEHVHPVEAEKFAKRKKRSWRMADPEGNLSDEAAYFNAFLLALLAELEDNPEAVLDVPIPDHPSEESSDTMGIPPVPDTKSVFIVHGHDELNVLRLQNLVRDRWSLEAVVLGPRAAKGRSLIEKFEQEAQSATFAFVLMTPDDMVAVENETNNYAQARPNVIFELGWFYGRLGRDRVCLLLQTGTKIHSDLEGVERIQFDQNIQEVVLKLDAELVAAGLLRAP